MEINKVDICCGLCWGDEAKGKIVSSLIKTYKYDFVCRWGGGSNAGHTIYLNGKKYHTHKLIFWESVESHSDKCPEFVKRKII